MEWEKNNKQKNYKNHKENKSIVDLQRTVDAQMALIQSLERRNEEWQTKRERVADPVQKLGDAEGRSTAAKSKRIQALKDAFDVVVEHRKRMLYHSYAADLLEL